MLFPLAATALILNFTFFDVVVTNGNKLIVSVLQSVVPTGV